MEIISALLIALSPFVLKVVTDGVKKVSSIQFSDNKTNIIRFIVALLSIVVAVGASILSGQPVDENAISTFVDALLVFLGTTGYYLMGKLK